jgi:hypothetical protein
MPVIDVLERVKVGESFEKVLLTTDVLLRIVMGLFGWQIVSQAVPNRTKNISPAHDQQLSWSMNVDVDVDAV